MVRRMLTAVLAVGLLLTTPAVAQAATWTWATRSAPLTVRSDGATGTILGQGHGAATVTGRTVNPGGYWRVDFSGPAYLRDRQPGGNSIYLDYTIQLLPNTSALMQTQSGRWNGAAWASFPASDYIIVGARDRRASIKVQVCEDQRFSFDPCRPRLTQINF